MINVNALRGIIAARGMTQQDVALILRINPKTFYNKMKKGVFGSDEIEKMISVLSIDHPEKIFFAKNVT